MSTSAVISTEDGGNWLGRETADCGTDDTDKFTVEGCPALTGMDKGTSYNNSAAVLSYTLSSILSS